MPDTRHHRGPNPEDARLFAPAAWDSLRQATADLCWLLTRGYALPSARDLVGNRYGLAVRQRLAMARCAASREAVVARRQRQVPPAQLAGKELWLDGLNVLTGLEVALSGGVVLIGADGCCRDVAGVHRHYRKVEETVPALEVIGRLTARWGVRQCRWWLDKPVSNTGRLKELMLDLASRSGWSWEVALEYNPDAVLSRSEETIASSDSVILDRCRTWLNLVRLAIAEAVPNADLVDLSSCFAPPVGEQ